MAARAGAFGAGRWGCGDRACDARRVPALSDGGLGGDWAVRGDGVGEYGVEVV